MTVTLTTGSAGTNCPLGLYRDVSGTPAGGALITESANISAASAVNKRFVFSSNMRLEAGYVWCAFETQDGTVAQGYGKQLARHSIPNARLCL